MVIENVGETCRDTFGDVDFGKLEANGYAFFDEWGFDFR
jgi:hypothetical protein